MRHNWASRVVYGSRLPLLLTAIICTGCMPARKPAPLQPPAVFPRVSYLVGAPLALPATRPARTVTAKNSLSVRMKWVALASPVQSLRPVLSDSTLIVAPRSANPFLAAGRLSRGSQIVPEAQVEAFLADVERGVFGQHAAIATSDAALPRGVTAAFALGDADHHIEIGVHRPNSAMVPATMPATMPTTRPTTMPATMPSDDIHISLALEDVNGQRERLLLEPRPMPPPARLALVLPSFFPAPQVKSIVAVIELAPPSSSIAHKQSVAKCAEQLARLALATRSAQTQPTAAGGWPGIVAALRAMNQPATSRGAMVYLADETGAELFGDAALVAPDPALAELSALIQKRLGDPPKAMAPAQLGWILDLVALEQMASLQSSKKIPPEMEGVLARYAGEAARNAGSLEDLARVGGRGELRARLIAENFIYLEDASPSARVRAYDWLRLRGRAPAHYDPLGPSKERTAALNAALAAPTTRPYKTIGGAP